LLSNPFPKKETKRNNPLIALKCRDVNPPPLPPSLPPSAPPPPPLSPPGDGGNKSKDEENDDAEAAAEANSEEREGMASFVTREII